MEPNPKLPRHLQLMQGLGVSAPGLVGGGVSCPAQVMEELTDLRRDHALVSKAVDEIELAGVGGRVHADDGGNPAGGHLRELAQLDQCSGWVVCEVPLSLGTQSDQKRVVGLEEAEVRRRRWAGGHSHLYRSFRHDPSLREHGPNMVM